MTPVLGIDLGRVRVGVAISDPLRVIATPVDVLARTPDARLWTAIARWISDREVESVVVGLPRHLDGSEGPEASEAREFATQAERMLHRPVELWDERLTTVAAERALLSQGMRRKQRRERIDAVAAALLLQSWLDAARMRTSP